MHRLFHRRAQDSVTRAIECPREICSIGSTPTISFTRIFFRGFNFRGYFTIKHREEKGCVIK